MSLATRQTMAPNFNLLARRAVIPISWRKKKRGFSFAQQQHRWQMTLSFESEFDLAAASSAFAAVKRTILPYNLEHFLVDVIVRASPWCVSLVCFFFPFCRWLLSPSIIHSSNLEPVVAVSLPRSYVPWVDIFYPLGYSKLHYCLLPLSAFSLSLALPCADIK